MVEAYADRILISAQGDEVPMQPAADDRRRTGPLAWLEYLAVRGILGVGRHLPDPGLRALLAGFAGAGRLLDGRHTRAAREFIRTALPGADEARVEALVTAAWKHLPRVALASDAIGDMLGQRLGDHYDLEFCEGLIPLLESGRGCLIVSAHVGVWEAMGLPLNALGFAQLHAVGKPPRNGPLADHMDRHRLSAGGPMISRKGAMQAVPKLVRGGGTVMMLLDHRARQRPVIAPFFGRPAACDRSAGVLVRRVNAPLVFAACYQQEGPRPYRLVFSRVVQPEQLTGLHPAEVMGLVNRESERLILACPEQYFWLHDRYKGLPREL